MRRFAAGDPLRGVAALSVLVFHLALPVLVLRADAPFGRAGGHLFAALQVGICVFFTLSGYLLARPFLRGTQAPAGAYLRRRALRIVPAFWVVTLVVLLLFGSRGSSPRQVLAVFGFVQTYDEGPFTQLMVQGWTLGAEVLFYVSLLALRRRTLPVFALAMLASLVVRLSEHGDRFTPPVMFFAFAPGLLLAVLEVDHRERMRRLRPATAPVLVGVAAVLLLAYAAIARDHVALRALLGTAGCACLVAGPLVREWTTGRPWRALDNPVMQWLGARSYAIYLVHVAVIFGFRDVYLHRGRGPWTALALAALAAVPVTLVLAELLHRAVERPFLRLRSS